MYAMTFVIKDHKNRETKSLRIFQVGQDIEVFIFPAVIQQYKYIVCTECGIDLCVFMYILMKTPAPLSPVASYHQEYMFTLLTGPGHRIIDLLMAIA